MRKRPLYPIHPGEILADELMELNTSPTELARELHVPARLFNASHPNPTLDTISEILRALGLQAEIKISLASPEEAPIPIKATFVPV